MWKLQNFQFMLLTDQNMIGSDMNCQIIGSFLKHAQESNKNKPVVTFRTFYGTSFIWKQMASFFLSGDAKHQIQNDSLYPGSKYCQETALLTVLTSSYITCV